jgi:hypothetical protein
MTEEKVDIDSKEMRAAILELVKEELDWIVPLLNDKRDWICTISFASQSWDVWRMPCGQMQGCSIAWRIEKNSGPPHLMLGCFFPPELKTKTEFLEYFATCEREEPTGTCRSHSRSGR